MVSELSARSFGFIHVMLLGQINASVILLEVLNSLERQR